MSDRLDIVVVGYDFSADCRRAADWAIAVARAAGARAVHLVHALDWPPLPADFGDIAVGAFLERQEKEIRHALATEAKKLATTELPVLGFLRRWLRAPTLLEHADEHQAGLLVVGRHGSRVSRLLVGSVTAEVARTARQPVVVVRGETATAPPRRVLVGLDGSAPSERALAEAVRWFPACELVAVSVTHGEDGLSAGELAAELQRSPASGRASRSVVRRGAPARELLAAAADEDPDLIAVGNRGRGALAEMLTGSVADKLLQLAPCPVLVAH